MTLKEAIKFARSDDMNRETWHRARHVIIDADLCPGCIQDNHRAKLLPWEAGDYYNHAGRRCPDCEDFFVCGPQPEYDTSPDCFSDADSGL